MESVLTARGHKVTVINPVENLLAVGHYLESTVDINESTKRIKELNIPKDHFVLMAGFTAGNDKGELVVLGRNGSDYSAAVLAACLRAECCEIWTDVDGVYTCDPRLVPDARLLKRDVLSRGDGVILLWCKSTAPAYHSTNRTIPNSLPYQKHH